MTLEELQNQVLQLPIGDRWRLVQLLLSSIQQETLAFSSSTPNANSLTGLDPWTKSLIGIIQLGTKDPTESQYTYFRNWQFDGTWLTRVEMEGYKIKMWVRM